MSVEAAAEAKDVPLVGGWTALAMREEVADAFSSRAVVLAVSSSSAALSSSKRELSETVLRSLTMALRPKSCLRSGPLELLFQRPGMT